MDRFDFDSILFPLSFPSWIKGEFGPSVYKRAKAAGKGILALKAMAHQKWPAKLKEDQRRWRKSWYEPFDEMDQAVLGLRFTLHLPVTALIPPGHWELFRMALDLAQAGGSRRSLPARRASSRSLPGSRTRCFRWMANSKPFSRAGLPAVFPRDVWSRFRGGQARPLSG